MYYRSVDRWNRVVQSSFAYDGNNSIVVHTCNVNLMHMIFGGVFLLHQEGDSLIWWVIARIEPT